MRLSKLLGDRGRLQAVRATEELRTRTAIMFREDQSDGLRDLVSSKIEELRQYDVSRMDKVAAVLCWGRSGSFLLASYLDGHEDVIMLPERRGSGIYDFFERHRSLPLREKLLGYAAYLPEYPRLFEGQFAIERPHYYAAVEAIVQLYGASPKEFLESRRAFIIFLNIAYNLAFGKRSSASPVIVFAQHHSDDDIARRIVEDFPQSVFIHTVRDPLTSYNSLVRVHIDGICKGGVTDVYRHAMVGLLVGTDRPHEGMESRTWTGRLEDLHRDPAGVMRELARRLGISYQPPLLDSTFNGIPYVFKSDRIAWSGRNLEQTKRHAEDLTRKDKVVLCSVFYENFIAWGYACPRILGNPIVRWIVVACFCLFPLNTEIIAARAVFKYRLLPSLRQGRFLYALKCLLGIALVRLKLMWFFVTVVGQRSWHPPTLLQIDETVCRAETLASV